MVLWFLHSLLLPFFDRHVTRDCIHSLGHLLLLQILWQRALRFLTISAPQPHTPTYTMFEQLSWHVVNPIGLPTFRLRIALSISSRTIGSLQFISFFDESDCCIDLSRREFTEVDRP